MHPIFRSRRILIGYLTGWLPVGLVLAFVLKLSTSLSPGRVALIILPFMCLLAIVCLSAWYVCRAFDLKSTPDWKLILIFMLAAMCGSTVVMMIGHGWIYLINSFAPGLEFQFRPAVPLMAAEFFLAYLLSIVMHYLILALESSQRAEVLSREAELKALKAQVNPHFLFNSLNSISALTAMDPAKAREMCIALSDFLRTSLRLGERQTIPLGEELALARSYLEVERVRFGQRLRFREAVESGCAECTVPPLLVQPLIENAIKHGIATLDEGGEICLATARQLDQLSVTVENPFDPDAPPAQQTGFGLHGVRNRIQARYGAKGKLEIEIQPACYRVRLLLPWDCGAEGNGGGA